MPPPRKKAQRINCVNNLKQVGLATRIWSGDNGDKYPTAVANSAGGPNSYVAANSTIAFNSWSQNSGLNVGYAYAVFQVMSNELSTPKGRPVHLGSALGHDQLLHHGP